LYNYVVVTDMNHVESTTDTDSSNEICNINNNNIEIILLIIVELVIEKIGILILVN